MVVNRAFLDALVAALLEYGYRVLGPVFQNGSIVIDDLTSTADMPVGWTDEQSPGNYRLCHSADGQLFGWTVSPASPKALLFPPRVTVWQRGAGRDDFSVPFAQPVAITGATKSAISTVSKPQSTGSTGKVLSDTELTFSASGTTHFNPRSNRDDRHLLALVGIRPCEAAALEINDAVFMKGSFPDPFYCERRSDMFLLVAECASSNASCFCDSMGAGPGIDSGFDLAVTEMLDEDGEYSYFLRIGSQRGEELFTVAVEQASSIGVGTDPSIEPSTGMDRGEGDGKDIPTFVELSDLSNSVSQSTSMQRASCSLNYSLEEVLAKRDAQLQHAKELQVGMHPRVAELLRRNLDHPIFTDIAGRCLACGNCTSVCPTCFCSDVVDKNDMHGAISRERSWSSCFNAAHSELHGQPVRHSVASRYRQWLTHKFSNWYDQFGTSGCVGCGRCITWCPVGIDVRQEVAGIASDADMKGDMQSTGSHGPS